MLFSNTEISGVSVKNRIIRSATHDGLADKDGAPSDKLILKYEKISKKALTVSTLSSLVLIGVRVFECIRPFTFEKELAASIGAKDINFAAMPVPTSASNVDFALNCKIDF